MMEDALLYTCCALALIFLIKKYGEFCFNVGIREGKLSTVDHINVLCVSDNEGYIFRDLLDESFLCQSKVYEDGLEILKSRFPEKSIIISRS